MEARPLHQARWSRALLATAAAWLLIVELPCFAGRTYANVDEGYEQAIAQRLLAGETLYQGAVSQRGPVLYYIYALLARVTHWHSVLSVRWLALACAVACLMMVYRLGCDLLPEGAGVIGAVGFSYALCFGAAPYDGIALNAELLLLPALLLGIWQGALSLRHPAGSRNRLWRLAVAGVSLAVAPCIKQTSGLHPFLLAAWLLLDARRHRTGRSLLVRDLAVFAIAASVIPLVVVIQLASAGSLHRFLYYGFTYNAQVHVHPTNDPFERAGAVLHELIEHPLFLSSAAIVILFTLGLQALRVANVGAQEKSDPWRSNERFLAANLLVAFVGSVGPPQTFVHYFLPTFPLLALLVGALAARCSDRVRGQPVLFPLLGAFCLAWTIIALGLFKERMHEAGRVAHGAAVTAAAHEVERLTRPEDSVFVWGFSPWLYGYSHRRPSTRFEFMTYVTGFVPWFYGALPLEAGRVVPDSMDELMEDLANDPPRLVIDAGSVQIARSMRAYARPADWLHQNYCFEERVGPFDLYARKVEGQRCATDCFPTMAPIVSYFDLPMAVPWAPLLDDKLTHYLPSNDWLTAARFEGSAVCAESRPAE